MPRIQLEVVQAFTTSAWTEPNQKPGNVVWVNSDGAKHLIEHGLCRLPKIDPPKPPAPGEQRRPMRTSHSAPLDRFAVVERAWEGQTVVCIAGGPSVTQEQVAVVERAQRAGLCKVAVVNDAYLIAPFADLLYFADARWWEWHHNGIAKSWPWVKFTEEQVRKAMESFAGQKVTIGTTGMMVRDPKVFMLNNDTSVTGKDGGLSTKPNAIRTGSNSGYQVMNVVALAGAKRIALIGYDMRFANGRSHSHNGHPLKMPESAYRDYARRFDTMLPQLAELGIEVVNCTPGSAITAFQRGDIAGLFAGS